MADENGHAQAEWPRKRQRTKGPAETNNVSGALSDPIKRATRACDQCRTQKKRCDSGRPCHTCTKASLDCHYGKQARKRGFPTGYVRIIEALWALVFRTVPSSQETALYLLRHSSVGYDDEGKATLLNFHFDKVDSSRKAWFSSSIRHEIDKLASELEEGGRIGLAPERVTSRSDPTVRTSMSSASDFATWTIPEDILGEELSCKHRENLAVPENFGTDPRRGATVLHDRHTELPVPLPADAWKLTEIYFRFNHSWLPIMPKHSIVRVLTELQDGAKCSSSQLSVLWAIFALASAQQPCRDGERSSISDKYYHEAMKTIPSESINLEPGHAEALVQLTILNMARGHWETASLVLRRAIRAILQLQRSYQYQQKYAAMESVLSRIILAAFAMDTLLAARSGTIPQLRSHDVYWAAQYDENEADEWEQWSTNNVVQTSGNGHTISRRPLRALSAFKQYVKLLSILNDSLCDLRPLEDYEVKLNDCRGALSSWKAQLPKHCQYPTTVTAENELEVMPSVANLHLTAEAVSRFLLARRDMPTDKVTPPSTSDESFPVSVYKTAYQEAFGPAAWRGILDFHENANHLKMYSNQTQIPSSDRDKRLDTRQLPVSGTVNYSVAMHKQRGQTGLEMLNTEPAAEASLARNFTRPHDPFFQHPISDGLFPNGIDDIMTDQVPSTARLDLNGSQVMDNISGADTTFVSFDINQGATSAANAPSHVYNDLGDENSIETLLEELSAQQNVSWDDMEAQCMYNLGFMHADHIMH